MNKKVPWARLLNILAESGYFIDNYPDISIPGNTLVKSCKYKPLRYIPLGEQRKLINAIFSKDHPCAFKSYGSSTRKDIRGMTATKHIIRILMTA